jgi:hypothetical protein
MCAFERKWIASTQDITFGGNCYSVCDHHAAHPIADPNRAEPPTDSAPFQKSSSTSRAGAEAVADKTGPQKLQVLGAVAWMGGQGATRNQVLKITGITEKAACGRLKDLVDEGKLYVEGERLEDTGCRQQIYHVNSVALREVAA